MSVYGTIKRLLVDALAEWTRVNHDTNTTKQGREENSTGFQFTFVHRSDDSDFTQNERDASLRTSAQLSDVRTSQHFPSRAVLFNEKMQ